MFCKKCGNKLEGQEKFCGKCGFETNIALDTHLSEEAQVNTLLEAHAKNAAKMLMLKGIGFAVLGIVITWIWYSSAEEGGTYYAFWGLMVVGAYQFLRGAYFWFLPNKLIEEAQKTPEEKENKSFKLTK
jgi:hypothetical protein